MQPVGSCENDRVLFATLDVLHVGVAWITKDYIHENANTRYCEILNRQLDEVMGLPMPSVWGNEKFDTSIRPDLEKCFSGERSVVCREIAVHFSGPGCRSYEITYHPYTETGDQITKVIVTLDDITYRIAKKTNLDWNEKFNSLTEVSRNPIILVDNGVIMSGNTTLSLLFGYVEGIVEGGRVEELIAPEHRDAVESAMREHAEGRIETVGLREDGTSFPLEVNFRRLLLEGRDIVIWAMRDLTKFEEIKRQVKLYQEHLEELVNEQMEEIRRREEQCSSIYENAVEGMFRTDAEGRLVAANTALARMFGFERPEDLNEKIWNLGDIYVKPRNRKETGKLLRDEGIARNIETEICTKDGSMRWGRMSVRAVKDDEGRILCYEGTLEDITERKWAEDKYRRIFLNATEGIFQITPDGRCFSANPALARIHGFSSPEELIENATDISKQLHVDMETWHEYLELMRENGYVRDHLWRMYRKDGTIAWLSINARAIRDETGRVLYHEGTVQDITDKKIMDDQILMQRDLALQLAQTGSVGEGMSLILETAVKASGMESGGIWLKTRSGELQLISSIGFSQRFDKKSRIIAVGSRAWNRMMSERRVLAIPGAESMPNVFEEGYIFAAAIPILHDSQVIASFNLFSRIKTTISEQALISLDFLTAQLGSIIVRMQAQQQVEQEIGTRREAEKALQAERQGLEEANIALKVLLGQREKDRGELEQRLVSNVTELVLPYLEKLKRTRLDGLQRTNLGLMESNLKEILSPFRFNIRNFNLTLRQVEIVNLIKQGRTTKEIAEIMNVSKDAIDKQRFIIRKKLGINRDKTNLRSLLLSL
ncbi:MAG: Sensor histidine kinase TmoS [Syntrophorhabdaceae bacterium PtaU1.Bin034]|jgi:PAS domain S-box-containing protein|nr:MAG: Sensor histidine kinase TmoS [Syntrophorhabdaceae bacterium PtaU1.Bin034]